MEIEIFDGNWTTEYVKNNPEKLFVFGDNNARVGKGGQAIIRELTNSIGLRTKKGPSNNPVAFYTDNEISLNKEKILEDILHIKYQQLSGKKIVFSSGGYGTGLASLQSKAPLTYEFLVDCLRNFFNFDNDSGKIWKKIPSFDEINFAKYITINKINKNILLPPNNSYFRKVFLEKGLNDYNQLITKGLKVAFTSNEQFNNSQILNINLSTDKYLVVKVCGSYPADFISSEKWCLFEGFNEEFSNKINRNGLFQTYFKFICTLDEKGNMIFNDELFSDVTTKKDTELKIVGETILEDEEDDMSFFGKKSFKRLLKENNIFGEIRQLQTKDTYQVKSNGKFYCVKFKKGFLKNSIDILIESKTSFI